MPDPVSPRTAEGGAPHPAPAPARLAGSLVYRVFSWCGLAPLAAFVLVHLVVNARVLRGEGAFLAAAAIEALPGVRALEAVLVLVPLGVHAAVGAWLVATGTPLPPGAPYGRSLLLAMRATGVVALGFVGLHLADVGLLAPGPRLGPEVDLTVLASSLSGVWHGVPWRGVVYFAGTASVTLHLVAGLWGAFARTARGSEARARRAAGWAAAIVGVAIWALFADVVTLYATGSRIFGGPAAAPASTAPCPAPAGSARRGPAGG